MATRKSNTSTEVSERYKKKTYDKFLVRLRKVDDRELIDYINQTKDSVGGISNLFREAMQLYKDSEQKNNKG